MAYCDNQDRTHDAEFCGKIVEKFWKTMMRRNNIADDFRTFNYPKYGGFTNTQIGPPKELKESEKQRWRHTLTLAWRQCIWEIFLPYLNEKENELRRSLEEQCKLIRDNFGEEILHQILNRGANKARLKYFSKYCKKVSCKNDLPPPPSPPSMVHKRKANGNTVPTTVSEIRRGEIKTNIKDGFVRNSWLKERHNVFMILAYAIYGRVRLHSVIVRNVNRYLDRYEKIEQNKFRPFMGNLENGQSSLVKDWKKFRIYIKNRDLKITGYELNIVAKLYDVQIRIMRELDNNNNANYIREEYICIWESETVTSRAVNLLITKEKTWALLEGIYIANNFVNQDKTEERDQDNILESQLIRNICSVIMTPAEDTQNQKDNQLQLSISALVSYNTGKDITYENIEKEESDVQDTTTTSSIEKLFYEEDKIEEETHNHNNNTIGKAGKEVGTGDGNITNIDTQKKKLEIYIHKTQGKKSVKNSLKNSIWQRCRILERNRRRNDSKKRERLLEREGKKLRNKNLVFDFTSEGLTEGEIELLSKGEGFSIANDTIDEDRLKTDLYNYVRRLKIQDEILEKRRGMKQVEGLSQFSKITDTPTQNSIKRNSHSLITPSYNTQTQNIDKTDRREDIKIRKLQVGYEPECNNRNLIRYGNCIQEEGLLVTKKKYPFKDNLTKELRVALKNLKEKVDNKNIVITKADKGSGIVIVDYELYINKGTHYIEEESKAYTKVFLEKQDIIKMLVKDRNKIVTKLKKEKIIHEQTATYCTHQLEEKVTGMKFYYKVHKDNEILTMPLRPLQSCISSPTHHLSQVLTDILQPLLREKNIPTFIQDSNQLLFRLNKLATLTDKDTIISSDVAALYPSIPHVEGLSAMKKFLEEFSSYNKTQIEILIRALELVITRNYVMWNGNIYEQTRGVAMGTPVAVAYANIFMNWIDTQIKTQAPYIIEHIRYIDDNLIILPQDKIEELIAIANNVLSPHIKYTYEVLDKESGKGLPFLDTQLFISEKHTIESRLYTKSTDRHAYLLPSSYHPPHITKNIPLSVFYRLRRVCSKEEWFKADVMTAITWLEDRDYSYKDICRAIGKAIDKDRWDLIESIERNRGIERKSSELENNRITIPLIVTYSQKTTQLKQLLDQRQDLLDASFVDTLVKPRVSYRRQNNIGDMLVQKSLRGPITGNLKMKNSFMECRETQKYRTICPCKALHEKGKCRCCAHAILELKDIKVKLFKEVTCDSKNIVYLIICRTCKKKYVGETQQKLRDRLSQHLNNINKLQQPLYIHFKTVHKPIDLAITVLETIRNTEPCFRKIREAWWINHLQTLEPRGFNAKLDCNQVYVADRHTLQVDKDSKNRWR